MVPTDDDAVLQGSFLSCLHYVLELAPAELPALDPGEDPAAGWTVSRWLGGLGLGLARVADASAFAWPGNWIARVHAPESEPRFAVMFGVPSGVVWDPAADGVIRPEWITQGYLVAATDIAQARPPAASGSRPAWGASRPSASRRRRESRRGPCRARRPSRAAALTATATSAAPAPSPPGAPAVP